MNRQYLAPTPDAISWETGIVAKVGRVGRPVRRGSRPGTLPLPGATDL
ncbi:MAG: hypothetical protein P8Z40_15890 [Chloroflexota bacterium]